MIRKRREPGWRRAVSSPRGICFACICWVSFAGRLEAQPPDPGAESPPEAAEGSDGPAAPDERPGTGQGSDEPSADRSSEAPGDGDAEPGASEAAAEEAGAEERPPGGSGGGEGTAAEPSPDDWDAAGDSASGEPPSPADTRSPSPLPATGEPGPGSEPIDDLEPEASDLGGDIGAVPPGDDLDDLEDAQAIEQLDLEQLLAEPVVTASGGAAEERVLAAANVIVVKREDIERRGWRSLGQVLASVPGLYVVDDHVIPSLGVRGVTGGLRAGTRLVKVMINGVPVNFRPDLTAFIGPELIPMDAVERVEIVQGPLSALYGANAFIATVNVITRDPADAPDVALAGRGTVINGNAGGGGSVLVTDHGENVGLLGAFSLDWQDRSGLNIDQTFPNQDPNADRFRHLFRERSQGDIAAPMSMYLRLDVGDPEHKIGKLTLQGGIQRLDSVGEFQVNAAMSHRSRYSIINYWSNASLVKRFSDEVSAELNLGYSEGTPTRDYRLFVAQDDDAFYRPRFGYRAINGGLNVHYSPLGEQLSFRIGADAEADFEDVLFYEKTFLVPFGERDPGDSLDLIGQDADRTQLVWDVGLSLQIKSVPLPETLPALRLTGNARVDFIEYGDIDFPTQFSWRAGIVYEWMDELVTKVVGGRAFQTPSPVLMFAKPGYGRANNVIGNADVRDLGFDQLEPQTVTGVEAIVSAKLFDAVSLDVSGYFQQIEDRILFSQLATDFIASNEESVQNVGGLASMKVDVDRVSGYATATVQRQIVDGTIVDQPPARFPNYFGTFGLNVDVPEAHLLFNAHLRWAGERGATQSNELINNAFYELDGYATVDLSVTTDELYLWNDDSETKLSFSVRNVADTQFSEPGFAGFDIPNLGRTFWFEARQRF